MSFRIHYMAPVLNFKKMLHWRIISNDVINTFDARTMLGSKTADNLVIIKTIKVCLTLTSLLYYCDAVWFFIFDAILYHSKRNFLWCLIGQWQWQTESRITYFHVVFLVREIFVLSLGGSNPQTLGLISFICDVNSWWIFIGLLHASASLYLVSVKVSSMPLVLW